MSWTDERVESLKKLWAEGLSASHIARQLGEVTRNAVIGKVHRLGLSGRQTMTRLKSRHPRKRVANPKRVAKSTRFQQPGSPLMRSLHHIEAEPFVSTEAELLIPLAERNTIETLQATTCRWPIGDPQTPEFHFCNGHKVGSLPYCQFHARRAYQVPQPRRRDVTRQPLPVLKAPGEPVDA